MKFFTRKWKDYIYINYEKFLIENKDKYNNIYLTYGNEIKYSDSLLKEKFDRYYKNKKKYVDSYEYLKKEFGLYEEIEILSYEEEFDNFKNRLKTYSNRLKEEAYQNIQKRDVKIDLEKADFRLLALNIYNGDNYAITSLVTLTNEVMGFLTGMSKYANDNNKLEYEKLKNSYIWFHDSEILEIGKISNYSYVVVLDNKIKYKISMKNGDTNQCIKFNNEEYYVNEYEYGYCSDKGYYLKLEELEIWGDSIDIEKL